MRTRGYTAETAEDAEEGKSEGILCVQIGVSAVSQGLGRLSREGTAETAEDAEEGKSEGILCVQIGVSAVSHGLGR